jgi:hypothetical protein
MDVENILNDDWIQHFEKTDKLYQDFYRDDLCYINLKIIYVNKSSEIEKIKHESFLMSSPNYISREEMIGILKKNTIDNNIKYTLMSILKYVINLEPDEIKFFLNNTDHYPFLKVIKNIDAITFERSINMFQDLNDLILVFFEKSTETKSANNYTKKIFLNSLSSKKKTTRKTI